MIKRASVLALTLLALSFAGQAKADYTLSLSALNPTSLNANGTMFTFAITAPSQPGFDGFTSPFNVIRVTEPSAVAQGSGSVTLSENFTLTGSTGTLSGTLTGTFTVTGATSTYVGSITNLVGSGFTVNTIFYSQPSVGTSFPGSISFQVTPSAVPEPASIAMVGLGLVGVGFAARRRLAK